MDEVNMVYFKSLNGFRALAAIFILLFHSMFPYFRTLWIGVPMFFVLSGFLITRILIEHKAAGNYLKAFYFKRALRIFPIYYLALLISVFWGLLVNADLSRLPVFIIYLQNFTISRNLLPEYCYGLMNHTWSLSVEELFYLVWPFVILFAGKKLLPVLIVFIGLSSILYKVIVISFFYTGHSDQLLLLSLAGNLDGLMAGALLGMLSLNKGSFLNRPFPFKQFFALLLVFTITLAANYCHFNIPRHFSVFKELLSVLAVFVSFYTIVWLISEKKTGSFFTRALNHPFMQLSGKISYGLYLYHALIFGITSACVYHFQIDANLFLLFLFKITLTYVVALLSWHAIEKPFLRLKDKLPYQS